MERLYDKVARDEFDNYDDSDYSYDGESEYKTCNHNSEYE